VELEYRQGTVTRFDFLSLAKRRSAGQGQSNRQ